MSTTITSKLTVVAVVTPEYIERLKVTMPTWVRKKQIAECPLILFAHKFDDLKVVEFVRNHFKDVTIVDWKWDGATQRENVFSAFVFGTPKYVRTPNWVKIDADAFFISDVDLFEDADFEFDLLAQRWGYTKPSSWLTMLDDWAESIELPGKPFLTTAQRYEAELRNSYGHRRIISYTCLHSMKFINRVSEYAKQLPVPSHDTFLWYMVNRLPGCKWKTKDLKGRGVVHCSRLESIKRILFPK